MLEVLVQTSFCCRKTQAKGLPQVPGVSQTIAVSPCTRGLEVMNTDMVLTFQAESWQCPDPSLPAGASTQGVPLLL